MAISKKIVYKVSEIVQDFKRNPETT